MAPDLAKVVADNIVSDSGIADLTQFPILVEQFVVCLTLIVLPAPRRLQSGWGGLQHLALARSAGRRGI